MLENEADLNGDENENEELSLEIGYSALGYFTDIADAEIAVKEARVKYHGEFAKHISAEMMTL